MRAGNNIGEDMQRLLNREQSMKEHMMAFSSSIDELRIQIRNEPDAEQQAQLKNLLNMLTICRRALE